jgi:NTE family protein
VTTAFVLTGGGSLGAVQVGMLQALAASGIRPDLLVGTSAGALNAVWVAGHGMSQPSLDELARVWVGLRRGDLFPLDLRHVVGGLVGRTDALFSDRGVRRLVTTYAGIQQLDEAQVPVHLVAADLLSGRDVLVSTGSVESGVLASAAIPGLFPPVLHGGRVLVDGAAAYNTGIAQAVDLGATVVYVLPTGSACALPESPRSAVGVALHALTLRIEQRLVHEVAALRGAATVKVLPPLCPLAVSAADFTHAAELIGRGRAAATDWIDNGGIDLPAPERFLSLHHHRARSRTAS